MLKKLFSSMFISAALSLGSFLIIPAFVNAETTSVTNTNETSMSTEKEAKKEKKKKKKAAKMANPAKEAKDVNVNTASVSELVKINGIGKSLAQKLVKYRTEKGKITSIDDLKNIEGFGPKIINKVKTQIVF